jgi:hypothetical protein
MSVNGRAGAKFEADLAAYAQTHGHPDCERRVMGGSKDRGDLAGIRGWVIEAKNEAKRDVPGALREAKAEAANAGVTRYAAIHKYRNHPISEAVVSLPFWLFLELTVEVAEQERGVA